MLFHEPEKGNNKMGRSLIVVHPRFERSWSFAADHFHHLWQAQGEVQFQRLDNDNGQNLGQIIQDPIGIFRLAALGVPVTKDCLEKFTDLKEATFQGSYSRDTSEQIDRYLQERNIQTYSQPSEGFWGQTVSEYGLALTLCGLRRIPQLHRQILTSLEPWDYSPPGGVGRPGARAEQFGDNPNFTSGTIAGKRVRIVGVGNIASRYASFVSMLGADVAAYDPYANEPCFHRAGARKEWHLDQLVKDADIFVPMVPLRESTRGLVTADHINALPNGCLVVMVTRARICDTDAIRRRVLADEISLAADVWDVEPLPLDDALLGRHNVVHTPHNAGRTIDANQAWAEKLAVQFQPVR